VSVNSLKEVIFATGRAAGGPRRFFAAGAGSEITVQTSIGGGAPAAKLSANDPNSP
jgi:hypothetical protein